TVVFGIPVAPMQCAEITLIARVPFHRLVRPRRKWPHCGVVQVDEIARDRKELAALLHDLRVWHAYRAVNHDTVLAVVCGLWAASELLVGYEQGRSASSRTVRDRG